MLRQSIFLMLLISLVGCAGLDQREASVKVNISSLQLLDSTLMEQRYLIKLRVQNRSRHTLDVDGLSFDVALNGKDFASGVSNQAVTIPPFDEALLEVKVSSSLFDIIRQIRSMQDRYLEAFQYEISGRVHTGNFFYSLPFRETGEIDLNVPASGRSRGI